MTSYKSHFLNISKETIEEKKSLTILSDSVGNEWVMGMNSQGFPIRVFSIMISKTKSKIHAPWNKIKYIKKYPKT